MAYEYDPTTDELIDRDPSSNELGKRLLRLQNMFDEPGSVSQELKDTKKDSTDQRRVPFKKKLDTKVTPKKLASEDRGDEFDIIEIPILMKEFQEWIEKNPSKDFKDFLKEQDLVLNNQKKQLDDMILSNALAKIDNAMGGIMRAKGGIIKDPTYNYYAVGGKVADLSDYEKELVDKVAKCIEDKAVLRAKNRIQKSSQKK